MRLLSSCLVVLVSLCAVPALAGEKLLQNDGFTGSGTVSAPILFPEYHGAGVVVTPAPGDYPAQLIGVDVLCAPTTAGGTGNIGAYVLDVWTETPDAGISPPPTNFGNAYTNGIQLTASTTQFNRFTFTSPVTVTQGSVFIGVREQTSSSFDGTTIGMDDGPTVTGHNWYYSAATGWSVITGTGSPPQSVDRNWIIRGVISQPDVPPTVTSIAPDAGTNELPKDVTITGDHFDNSSRAFLGTTELTVNSRVTPNTLYCTVPAGLPGGLYDVVVENPAVPNPLRGTLPNGYRVIDIVDAGTGTGGGAGGGGGGAAGGGAGGGGGGAGDDGGVPAGLTLDSVTPSEIWGGDKNDLTILGTGFDPDVQLLIAGKVVDTFERKSAAVITTTLPPKTLSAGTYDITVINSDGAQATLKDGLKVNEGVSVPSGCSCNSLGADAAFAALALVLARRKRAAAR